MLHKHCTHTHTQTKKKKKAHPKASVSHHQSALLCALPQTAKKKYYVAVIPNLSSHLHLSFLSLRLILSLFLCVCVCVFSPHLYMLHVMLPQAKLHHCKECLYPCLAKPPSPSPSPFFCLQDATHLRTTRIIIIIKMFFFFPVALVFLYVLFFFFLLLLTTSFPPSSATVIPNVMFQLARTAGTRGPPLVGAQQVRCAFTFRAISS